MSIKVDTNINEPVIQIEDMKPGDIGIIVEHQGSKTASYVGMVLYVGYDSRYAEIFSTNRVPDRFNVKLEHEATPKRDIKVRLLQPGESVTLTVV